MKITLFTSNNTRHNYFINLLSAFIDELFVVQECSTIFHGIVPGRYPASEVIKNYFKNVNDAQMKLFGNSYIRNCSKKISLLPVIKGDLNRCSLSSLSNFLKSDLYIIYGSSYIKGDLANFLVKHKAINIHIGVSPYYRGTDCNFWALYDENPHLVGSTIHILTKGLDSGPILYHAMSNIKTNPYEYTMSTVKAAFHSIVDRIRDGSIFKIEVEKQNKAKEIRYSKNIEFNEEILKKYLNKKTNLQNKKFDLSLLKDPYFYS